MPVVISGETYSTKDEVAAELGINPVTLWRWRKRGVIPTGLRSRSRQVLFRSDEVAEIREYANRLEPIELRGSHQLRLFGKGRQEEET